MEQRRLPKDSTLRIKQSVLSSVARIGDEWHIYCDMLEALPYAELITMEGRQHD